MDFKYDANKFDGSNLLVLNAKKEGEDDVQVKITKEKRKAKQLSRKEKKRLENILLRKKKKVDVSSLIKMH